MTMKNVEVTRAIVEVSAISKFLRETMRNAVTQNIEIDCDADNVYLHGNAYDGTTVYPERARIDRSSGTVSVVIADERVRGCLDSFDVRSLEQLWAIDAVIEKVGA